MNTCRYVSYVRVSTDRQGASGLGLDAQRQAVAAYVAGKGTVIAEYQEVESGKRSDRPQLALALTQCRMTGATLVVAKLDRLARDVAFLLSVVAGCGDAGVAFCDLPSLPAGPVGKFMLTQMAAVAELEAGLISQRTKAALAQCKERGVKLGGWRGGKVVDWQASVTARQKAADAFAASVRPMIAEMRAQGSSLAAIASQMASQGIRTRQGGQWTANTVKQILDRA